MSYVVKARTVSGNYGFLMYDSDAGWCWRVDVDGAEIFDSREAARDAVFAAFPSLESFIIKRAPKACPRPIKITEQTSMFNSNNFLEQITNSRKTDLLYSADNLIKLYESLPEISASELYVLGQELMKIAQEMQGLESFK